VPLALGRALSVGHQKMASIPGVTMIGDFPQIDCVCLAGENRSEEAELRGGFLDRSDALRKE
jgi:hypothetical protein